MKLALAVRQPGRRPRADDRLRAVLTRILGVLALFTFIVTGVFLIADPAFLGRDDD